MSEIERMHRLSRMTAAAAVASGALVLLGWVLDVPLLKRWFPGNLVMVPNTAIGSCLLGSGLLLAQANDLARWRRRVAQGLAALSALIGLLSLMETWLGWDLGIDELLFHTAPEEAIGLVHPGRMGGFTSLSFVLLSIALILPSQPLLASWIGVITGLIAIVVVLDYAIVPSFSYTHVALHTALVLIALAIGVVCMATPRGLGGLWVSTTLGGTLVRRIVPAAIGVPIVVSTLWWPMHDRLALSPWTSVAAMTVAMIAGLLGIAVWTATLLERKDQEQARSAQELRVAQSHLRAVFQAMAEGLVFQARDGRLVECNDAACRILGLSPDEMMGRTSRDARWHAVHEDGTPWPGEEHPAMVTLRTGQTLRDQIMGVHSPTWGGQRWISINTSPLWEHGTEAPSGVVSSFSDVTERWQTASALQESETKFRVLADFVPQLIWECRPDGSNTYFNERWVQYTGLSLEESYGTGWAIPFHEDDKQAAWDAWNHSVTTGEPYHIESRLRAADGSYRWFLMRGVPLRDGSGAILRWFGSCTDIEDLKRTQQDLQETRAHLAQQVEALRRAHEAAEAAGRAKTDFLASMSHEIRTPLTALLGFADLMLEARLSEDDRLNYAMTIRRNGEHLLAVVNDILDFSRIEAGKLAVESVTFSPARVLAEVASLMRVHALEKGLSLEVEDETSVPGLVRGDPLRVRQILLNLVSNAVKFTERGVVCMLARFERAEERRGHLTIRVRDTGIGMDEAQLGRLFEPFSQADASMTRRFGGSGLGLAICAPLARAMGGSLEVSRSTAKAAPSRSTCPWRSLQRLRCGPNPSRRSPRASESPKRRKSSLHPSCSRRTPPTRRGSLAHCSEAEGAL